MKRVIVTVAILLCAVLPSRGGRAASGDDSPTMFRLSFAIATVDGEPVVDHDWLEARVASANRIFEPTDVQFRLTTTRTMSSEHARLDTRRDRHALGALVRDDVINLFVVQSLRDVHEPSRFRQGVHWRSRTHEGTHYVILSKIAQPTTLAHELGHFFGNRRHRGKPDNIMSYAQGDGAPHFNEQQTRRIRRFTRRYLRSGELVPVGND